jgi:tyrosinase
MTIGISRRAVLAAAAAAAAATPSAAQGQLVRPNIVSPAGQANILKYAQAVKAMMALPASDPHSWTYQWYIHSIPRNLSKAKEIARLFPIPSAGRTLAEAVWDTCKAHHANDIEDDFLPWHRMYVLQFEETIRTVLKDPSFVLPFWSYTETGQGFVPQAFRRKGDPVWRALYRDNRNAGANGGAAIDAGLGAQDPISADALQQISYRPKGADLGFCAHLDQNLHGGVHVLVGDQTGMGDVPTAAGDPVFWMHHCNIDRMWASWNALGGRNPTDDAWASRTFVLPDGHGGRMERTIASVLDLAQMPYAYESLVAGQTIVAASAAAPPRPITTLARSPAPIALSDAETQVVLGPTGVKPPKIVGAAARRNLLVVSALSADLQPGTLYRLELQADGEWSTAGFVHFFDAVAHGGMAHDDAAAMAHVSERAFAFDVTRLTAGKASLPQIRIRPVNGPVASARPVIGRLELVEG